MLLESVKAENFRNLWGELVCVSGLNILLGENGQGKTNWLEAIYLLSAAKSFKTAKLSEAVKFGEDLSIVRGRVRRSEEIHRELRVTIEKNIRSLAINSKQVPAREYLGQLHAVLFNAHSLEVVRGGPEARRRFLDDLIVSVHPPYIQTLTDYARVIRQKNSLLQTAREKQYSVAQAAAALEPWNTQAAELATRIHRSRVRITERIDAGLERGIFGREHLSLRYVSSLEGKGPLDQYAELIAERLALRVQAELAAGYALVGPHRDDMEILFDGNDLRKFGSSGQQRSALLLLLIANISVYHSIQNEYPLFLVDDIDAELDLHRIRTLLEYLEGKTQTIVTTSKRSVADEFGTNARVTSIESGGAAAALSSAAPGQ